MFRTLRTRLILSHVLPILLVIPLIWISLLYILENRFLLPVVYNALEEDATLLAEIVRLQPGLWENPIGAQALVESAGPFLGGRATLILPDGRLLASSDPADAALQGQQVELPDFKLVQQGQVSRLQSGPSAEVFVPILAGNGRLLGIVRLSTHVVTVSEQIFQLRYLIGAVFVFGIATGVIIAGILALQIDRPVQHVTEAIHNLAEGDFRQPIPVEGPEEIQTLAGAVNSLTTRLQNLEQARRQLLANLVHELGRPLGALRAATQALLKGAAQDPQLAHDLLTGMDAETARLQRLLDDLAELYDQVLGTLELNRRAIALSEWLPVELLPWQSAASAKSLQWQVEIPENLPPIQADPDRLSQALGNLVSNALKFTPAGGTVSVRAGRGTGEIWVEVSDTGQGIPAGEMEKIFLPFFRGDQGRRIVQGMGLGLTIARDILNAHRGRIEVESTPEKGSRFRMVLPVST
ncbi:MAG TPA: ATP-binding protein [Anaerolineales bacterium]|nr:ATP-binding protein [Anaerolineales bacterium]